MVFPWKKAHNEKIFINYRRDDAGGFAGRLSDTLAAYFGRDRVFRDVTDINYGHDFEQVIDEKLSESGAVVVLIGDKWTSATDKDGKRRLDDPADYVSREISAALQSAVPVIPVLIGDATMPRMDELPEKLGELTRRNAMTITDERWDFDVARLAKVLAIDVPGSVAQRKLNVLKSMALLLLFASGTFATVVFCAAMKIFTTFPLPEAELKVAGFTPLVSAFPFIAILLAGTLALVAAPFMEESKRKFAWAATSLAYLGTLVSFIYYGMENMETPSWSLVVNFGASTLIIVGVLVLMSLAAFKAE
jgi:hypothetical protein